MDESIRIVGIIEYSRKSLSSFHVGFVEGCGTRVSRFVHKFYRVQLSCANRHYCCSGITQRRQLY